MKVTVLQEELSKLLSFSSRFVSSRSQLPILENFVFEAKGTRLIVRATNLETSLVASVGAKVEIEGALAVPAKTINDLVSNLTGEKLVMESLKESLKLTCDGFRATLAGMNTSDFPVLVEKIEKDAIEIAGRVLVEGLSKVLPSVSRDDTRPVLTGVLFSFDSDTPTLNLVASDGFRLSQKKVNLKTKVVAPAIILPRGVLGEIVRLAEEQDVTMEVRRAENQVVFGLPEITLGSRVIEGEFPSFERIIPKETRVKVEVNKEEFMNAVKLGSIFARDGSNIVKLTVGETGVNVSAVSAKSGKQEMEIVGKVSGEGVQISYNYRFLEELLGVIEGESVEMEFTDEASPGVFRDPKDPDFFHLIMPVRVQGE